MAHRQDVIVDVCEIDPDSENLEGGEAGPDSSQFIRDPGTSSETRPEAGECRGLQDIHSREPSPLHRRPRPAASLEMLPLMPRHRAEAAADADDYVFGSKITEKNKRQLLAELKGVSVNDVIQKLRTMPLSLTDKAELRKLVFMGESSLISRNIQCDCQLSRCLSKTLRHGLSRLSLLTSLHLWHWPMKRLSGRFGTAVLSYFLFLRTLLFFNLFLFVIGGLVLILPQAFNPPPSHHHHDSDSHTFSGLELLTGTGYFSHSLMFYGYYSHTIIKPCESADSDSTSHQPLCSTEGPQMPYSIPTAYFFSIVIALLITCISLVYSMSKSFGRHFQALKSNANLAVLVFCSWDFKVTKKTSVLLQSEKISTQLREQLSEMIREKEEKSCMQRLCCLMVHTGAWAMCLTCISLTAMGVYHLSEATNKQDLTELLFLSAVVSAINLLLPGLFNTCSHLEKYSSPAVCIYVSIIRNLLLKVSVVAVLCYRWLDRIAVEPCWESLVGQELYRLLLMDFIFIVMHTVVGDFLWRLFFQKIQKRKMKPAFNIADNVLELIYGQTLTWLGLLFAPLLPAVQLIKLFVLFYIKRTSLMLNCQVPKKPWRATQMSTLFISLLCFPSFFGAAMSITYAVVTIKPSSECGPFRNLSTVSAIGRLWAQQLEESHPNLWWLSGAYNSLVENPLFIFLCAGVFLMVIYIHAQVVDGQRKVIGLLEKQLENEGKDKMFLVSKLQAISE